VLWLDGARSQLEAGLRSDPTRGRLALEVYAKDWLDQQAQLSPRTREIYSHQLEHHILPSIDDNVTALGHQALASIAPELVRAWYLALTITHMPSIAAKSYVRLRQVLSQAVDDERIVKNPCRIRRGGVERHPEQRFATMAELLTLSRHVPERYRAMVLTAGLAGLRQGELLALRRVDLDLDAGIVHVRRKRQTLDSGEILESAPKSEAGRRSISLPMPLVAELRWHLEHYVGPKVDSYVFTSADGQPIERNNFRIRVWLPATKAAGMKGFRFHDLRHTAGTLAARTGATTKELMARLGHASSQAATVYQHSAADGIGTSLRDWPECSWRQSGRMAPAMSDPPLDPTMQPASSAGVQPPRRPTIRQSPRLPHTCEICRREGAVKVDRPRSCRTTLTARSGDTEFKMRAGRRGIRRKIAIATRYTLQLYWLFVVEPHRHPTPDTRVEGVPLIAF
jgi:integrase